MSMSERIRALVEPLLSARDIELVDVEYSRGTLRVVIDRPGGIDLDSISAASEVVSVALDRHDPVPGPFTLEVSSPGVERPLRTPQQFRRFVGTTVALKTVPGTPGDRRVQGRLSEADDQGVLVEQVDATGVAGAGRRLAYGEIERARTVFEWGPAPRPGRGRPAAGSSGRARSNTRPEKKAGIP